MGGRTPAIWVCAGALLWCLACAGRSAGTSRAESPGAGRIRIVKRTAPAFDRYTNSPAPPLQAWMRDHFARMVVFTPYFNTRSEWYPSGLVYINAYAVYSGGPTAGLDVARVHPDWILRDGRGDRLYIDWGCDAARHTCPQYAGDFGNPQYRAWWIRRARETLAEGNYRGLWIDDVNLDWRIGNGDGKFVNPIDPRTGAAMTIDDWRRYMAEFMEQVRRELPRIEIVHNAVWYAGRERQDMNLYVRRQILAADLVNIEHGVNDAGLKGGDGRWSLRALLDHIDRVEALGRHFVLDGIGDENAANTAALEYAVAGYLLVADSGDFLGDYKNAVTPDRWWPGLDTDLGDAVSRRYTWKNGLMRRDFTRGFVLLNEPDAPARTAPLERPHRRAGGLLADTLTLGPAQGAVLTFER